MDKINIYIGGTSVERRTQIAFVSKVNFDALRLQGELRTRAGEAIKNLNPSYVINVITVERDEHHSGRYILTYANSLDEGKLLELLQDIENDVLEVKRADHLRNLVA